MEAFRHFSSFHVELSLQTCSVRASWAIGSQLVAYAWFQERRFLQQAYERTAIGDAFCEKRQKAIMEVEGW
jgi:hypothetical protein